MSTTRRAQVQEAVAAIRAFHALGRTLAGRAAPADAQRTVAIEAAAEQHCLNPDTVRKARQFAGPQDGYTRVEVTALCTLIRRVQPGQADGCSVFGRTHLIRMLGVRKQSRASLQSKAVNGGWSVRRLEAEIAARYGSRRAGGRKRRVPTDTLGRLAQVERLCEGWRRWVGLLTPPPAKGKADPPLLHLISPKVQRQVSVADAAVAELHRVVTAELAVLRPRRAVRFRLRPAGG